MSRDDSDTERAMDDARRELGKVYRPAGVDVWMNAPRVKWWNLTPEQMIRQGRIDEVMAEIEWLTTGGYS